MEEKGKNNYKQDLINYKIINYLLIVISIFLFVFICPLAYIEINYSLFTESNDVTITNSWKPSANEFNFSWEDYEGKQTGTQVKSLLSKLIANANTFKEVTYVPSVKIVENDEIRNINYNNTSEYISALEEIRKLINPRKHYVVSLEYSDETKLINKIILELYDN